MSTPSSDIAAVSNSALNGSPFLVVTLNTFRKGMTPSAAMACNNLGAPAQISQLPSLLHQKSRFIKYLPNEYIPVPETLKNVFEVMKLKNTSKTLETSSNSGKE